MGPANMSSADAREPARLQRLLNACRHGLHHDLTNQLVALRGLLQLLEQDEAQRLSPAGQDYIRRLLGVGERTQALAHTLRELSRLGGAVGPREMVALPVLIEEVVAELQQPPACVYAWEAPRTFAPRPLLRQAVALALSLLHELDVPRDAALDFRSQPVGPGIELAIGVGLLADTSSRPTPSKHPAGSLASTWHDRLECVLLRELAFAWGGDVRWHRDQGSVGVVLTLPAAQ
jgi:signal transduction histidine kinase